MNRGSLNMALKKGVSTERIANRQILHASEHNRKRRDELIQKKRGRIEPAVNFEQRSPEAILPDRSHLDQYVVSVLTEDPTTLLQAVKQIRRLLSQSRNGSCALLAEDGQYVDDVIQTGVVSSFVKFLGYSHMPKLQFEAVWALTNIASGTSEQTSVVVNAGSVEPLLALLHSDQIEVQEQSVWALGNISGDCDEYRTLILEKNGFGEIVQFAQANLDKVGVVKNCVWCLSNLCRNVKQHPACFAYIQPHLPFLQKLFQCNIPEVVGDACWAFGFLAEVGSEHKKEIIAFINPTYLLRLILQDDIHLQSPALRLTGNIVSGDEEDTQLLLNAGLLKVLAAFVQKANEIQKKEVLWIISNVTAGTAQQVGLVINIGFIKYLITAANGESTTLQIEAIWGVCNAINGGTVEQIRYIVERGAIPPLIRMLSQTSSQSLMRNILISIHRIIKVGNYIQQHCRLNENPYFHLLQDVGGIDRILDIRSRGYEDFSMICEHILHYCDLEEDEGGEEEGLTNF